MTWILIVIAVLPQYWMSTGSTAGYPPTSVSATTATFQTKEQCELAQKWLAENHIGARCFESSTAKH